MSTPLRVLIVEDSEDDMALLVGGKRPQWPRCGWVPQDYVMKNNLKRFLPAIQRKLQEAAQRRKRKRLEHQVQELQKFEAIGRLAGGIAHDFNNALGVILGWAQLGYDNVPDNRPVRENFRMIRDQAQRSAGLTRTKSTTWSRTSCGTQLPVRVPQVFFLARRAPPSTRPGLRPWSGPSSPRTQSVSVSPPPGDGDAPEPEKQPLRSRRTPFASGRTPSAAGPVPHTGPRRAPCPKGVASRWLLSLLRCNASVPSSYVRSAILTEERFLHFQLRQDRGTWCFMFASDGWRSGQNGRHENTKERQ